MKKHTFYYIALSALAMLTGCSEEDGFGLKPIDGNRSLTATIEQNNLSRTAVSEEGQVSWTETDAIGVFGTASQNIRFAYQSSTGNGSSATFRGDFPEEEPMEQAYYPYQEEATLSGNSLTLNLPSEYTYTGNSNAPMLGIKNDDGTFTFKHLTGLLRITINNVPEEAERFVITSSAATDAPNIAGQATVTDITADDASLSITANGSQSITYRLGTLTEETGFRTFFVPLPIGEYPQLSVSLYAKDRTDPYFTKTVSDITVRRAVMIDMPILDAQTGAQYVLSENTTEITESMAEHISVSPDDNTTLIYGSGIAEEDVPQVGDIIFAKPSDSLPYGFLGKVTSISGDAEKGYTIQTGTASLYEAFDKLYINDTAELVTITPSTRANENETEDDLLTGNFGIDEKLEVAYTDKESPYQIEGTLSAGASLQLTVEIDKEKQLKYMAFTFVPFVKAGVEFSVSDGWNEEGEFGDFPLKDYNCGLIMLGGVVPLVPAVQLHLYVQPQGSFSFTTGIECEAKGAAGAEFKNNVWESGFNPIKSDEKSPLDFLESEIKVEGELFYGFGVELKGKFFNLNNMKMFIQPKAGLKLSGDFTVSSDNTLTWEEKLKDLSIASSNVLSGSAGVDATLLGEDAESVFDFSEVEWGKKEYRILPILSKLSSQLMEQVSRTETTSSDALEVRDVSITAEASGELLTQDAKLHFELEDAEGNVIRRSSPIEYNVQKDGETQPLKAFFSGLQPDANYKAYVVIDSPMFSDISEENRVELKTQAVEFDTDTEVSDRELLIEFYKATGGDNWTNNENWCSDKPIEEWYGIGLRGKNVGVINLDNNNLTGTADLRKFKNLMSVSCTGNSLTSIDVSGLEILEFLYCNNNKLTSLNVSGAKQLEIIHCQYNQLTNIQLVDLPELFQFICDNNKISQLDIAELANLAVIGCAFNQLTSIDVSQLKNLQNLDFAQNQIKSLSISDLPKLSYLRCNFNDMSDLDLTNLPNLENLICGNNLLTSIDLSNFTKLKIVDCNSNQLTNLNIANLNKLEELDCHNNQLSNLSTSGLTNLKKLHCYNNQLINFGTSSLSNLEELRCDGNQLKLLDVSNLTHIKTLWCDNNQLSNLDTSSLTNIEDLSCSGNLLTSLNVSNFTQLKSLGCSENQLTKLDISNLANLETLYCSKNQLTELEISRLIYLRNLDCSNNLLTTLPTSNLTNLYRLDCSDNQLTTLNVSNSINLNNLLCDNNSLYNITLPIGFTNYSCTTWGEQDDNKYKFPAHKDGYQYPEFIYK